MPQDADPRTLKDLLDYIRSTRRLMSPFISRSTGQRIQKGGWDPKIVCADCYERAAALCRAEPSIHLLPKRGTDPEADLNNLERWCLAEQRRMASRPPKAARSDLTDEELQRLFDEHEKRAKAWRDRMVALAGKVSAGGTLTESDQSEYAHLMRLFEQSKQGLRAGTDRKPAAEPVSMRGFIEEYCHALGQGRAEQLAKRVLQEARRKPPKLKLPPTTNKATGNRKKLFRPADLRAKWPQYKRVIPWLPELN